MNSRPPAPKANSHGVINILFSNICKHMTCKDRIEGWLRIIGFGGYLSVQNPLHLGRQNGPLRALATLLHAARCNAPIFRGMAAHVFGYSKGGRSRVVFSLLHSGIADARIASALHVISFDGASVGRDAAHRPCEDLCHLWSLHFSFDRIRMTFRPRLFLSSPGF